jgi:peroxiredoxin
MAIAVGEKAPDFELKDLKGNTVRLSDFAGKKHVVLSFHPLAWTRVCAAQMLALDLQIEEFRKRETEVFGVSVDSAESKRAWAAALNLRDLPILADFWPHGALAESLGILREKYGSSERAVILIDKAGIVRWVNVYPIKDVPQPADVLRAIDALA